ncbi:MAG TPA: helix-turn-helix transcriptional regulator [Nitrosospira sp.]|nr:helix-turn-helix transcriptional regulator [Nitrosospira sp.]
MATRISQRLGKNLAMLRKQRAFTQAFVAERVGVDAETISRFERGAVTPSLATLESLCAVLECSWAELLDGVSTNSKTIGAEVLQCLAPLSEEDRLFLLEQVKVWARHLKR